MNTKGKGWRSEHKTMKLLEAIGFDCIRAGASLGRFDIIAWNKKEIKFIQVKTNNNPPKEEMEALQEYSNLPENAVKELWVWYDRERKPRIKVL